MTIFSASATTINKIQAVSGIASVIGLFYFDFNFFTIMLTVGFFYLYSIFGVSLTLHRFYSHKGFEFRYAWMKWFFTFIAVLTGRGSPLGWVYVHRLHHAHSDTDKDPHSPHTLGFKLFGFKHIEEHAGKMQVFLVKELMTKEQIFINKYYLAIILAWLAVVSMFGIQYVYLTWLLPVFLVQLSQNCFNYFAHMYGHRNFDTRDTSTNNIYLWPFILGDAWHNNHHSNAAKNNTKVRSWELDPIAGFINLVRKPELH